MDNDQVLDTSPELEPDTASYFQTVIGIIRWIIKLGEIDLITKVLLLSFHVALPREEHLDAAVHAIAHAGKR